jgi:hypothetical protein
VAAERRERDRPHALKRSLQIRARTGCRG